MLNYRVEYYDYIVKWCKAYHVISYIAGYCLNFSFRDIDSSTWYFENNVESRYENANDKARMLRIY